MYLGVILEVFVGHAGRTTGGKAEEKIEEMSDSGIVHEPAFGWFRLV